MAVAKNHHLIWYCVFVRVRVLVASCLWTPPFLLLLFSLSLFLMLTHTRVHAYLSLYNSRNFSLRRTLRRLLLNCCQNLECKNSTESLREKMAYSLNKAWALCVCVCVCARARTKYTYVFFLSFVPGCARTCMHKSDPLREPVSEPLVREFRAKCSSSSLSWLFRRKLRQILILLSLSLSLSLSPSLALLLARVFFFLGDLFISSLLNNFAN